MRIDDLAEKSTIRRVIAPAAGARVRRSVRRGVGTPATVTDGRPAGLRAWSYAWPLGAVFLAYIVTAKVGIGLSVAHGVVTPVWAPTGIALAAVLLGGSRLWPAIFVAAVAANATSGASVAAALMIGAGNTLESLVGAYCLRRFARFSNSLNRVRDVLALSAWGGLVAPVVSATIGVSALWLTGAIPGLLVPSDWALWWFGDAMGAVIVAPFVLTWAQRRLRPMRLGRATEAVFLMATLFIAGSLVLFGRPWTHPYALFPLLIWASLRFRQVGAATAVFAIFCITVWATLSGSPPIAGGSLRQSLLWLQAWVGVVGVATLTLAAAITERERAEAALRASEETLRTVFETASTGMARTDVSGRYLHTNPAYQRMVGYTAAELAGMRFSDLVHPEDLPRNLQLLERLLAGNIPSFQIEKRYVRKDGSAVWVENSVSVVRDSQGKPKFIHAVSQDITDLKKAEVALREQKDELARSNAALEEYAYVASHDLQEPLRMVTSFVQLLQQRYKGKLGSEADLYIGHAVDGAARMRDLIQGLLAYSRAGAPSRQFQTTDLQAVVDRALDEFGVAILESQARIEVRSLPTVRGDPRELGQLFHNLIGNAIKYRGPGSPCIEIRSARLGDEWVIRIRDNGIGIHPDFHERVFGMFKRLHTPAEYPGTGIGLAICRKIVEAHGGRIWVESEPGHGATFAFTIPSPKRT